MTESQENKRGRPLTYSEDMVIKAKEYLNSCVDEKYTLVKTEGDKSTSWENKVRVKLPTIEGLAVYLNISRETVYDWETKYDDFSDILGKLRAEQADRLINNGISGDYNPTIAKVLLTKHGYREGQDITSNEKTLGIKFAETFNGELPETT